MTYFLIFLFWGEGSGFCLVPCHGHWLHTFCLFNVFLSCVPHHFVFTLKGFPSFSSPFTLFLIPSARVKFKFKFLALHSNCIHYSLACFLFPHTPTTEADLESLFHHLHLHLHCCSMLVCKLVSTTMLKWAHRSASPHAYFTYTDIYGIFKATAP